MVVYADTLTEDARDLLKEDDPSLLDEYERDLKRELDRRFPEPDLGDVESFVQDQDSYWQSYQDTADTITELRYQRDTTPEKWARHLEQGRRIFTRLTHNEILRVTSLITRNDYRVRIPPAGPGDAKDKRAEAQQRFCQEFLPANERRAQRPLRRIVVDGAVESGLAGWEVYLTGSYDDIPDLGSYKDIEDEVDGVHITRAETDQEYMRRTDAALRNADLPIRIRPLHRASFRYERDDDGIARAVIKEKKPYRQVYAALQKRLSTEQLEEARLPQPGTPGWPVNEIMASRSYNRTADVPVSLRDSDSRGDVVTYRYYDRRWYMYVVGGIIVDGPRLHGLPGVPCFPLEGIVTSSPNASEQLEGITWGMASIEMMMNDLLTLGADVAYTYSRPRPIAEADPEARDPRPNPNRPNEPPTIDLTDPHKVKYLTAGWHIKDAWENFNPKIPFELLQTGENLWQRSGRNPIAQGASPGADAAGYTVNSLMGAADDLYGIILDNDARTWGQVLDFVRQIIKYTLKERVYLPVPGKGSNRNTVEWLALGPNDIDESPTIVTIDPTTEQNRLAKFNTLLTAWQAGLIPRDFVQREALGAEDPSLWDIAIAIEMGKQRLMGLTIDSVMQRVLAMSPQNASVGGPPGPNGTEGGAPPPGAPPAGAPTVGADLATASVGAPEGIGNASSTVTGAAAGQNNGYVPMPGAESSGPKGG